MSFIFYFFLAIIYFIYLFIFYHFTVILNDFLEILAITATKPFFVCFNKVSPELLSIYNGCVSGHGAFSVFIKDL